MEGYEPNTQINSDKYSLALNDFYEFLDQTVKNRIFLPDVNLVFNIPPLIPYIQKRLFFRLDLSIFSVSVEVSFYIRGRMLWIMEENLLTGDFWKICLTSLFLTKLNNFLSIKKLIIFISFLYIFYYEKWLKKVKFKFFVIKKERM